jgi:hypothetical protein
MTMTKHADSRFGCSNAPGCLTWLLRQHELGEHCTVSSTTRSIRRASSLEARPWSKRCDDDANPRLLGLLGGTLIPAARASPHGPRGQPSCPRARERERKREPGQRSPSLGLGSRVKGPR